MGVFEEFGATRSSGILWITAFLFWKFGGMGVAALFVRNITYRPCRDLYRIDMRDRPFIFAGAQNQFRTNMPHWSSWMYDAMFRRECQYLSLVEL